jgi:protein SCO1/2
MKYIMLLSILFFSCESGNTTLPYYNSQDLTPKWISQDEVKHQISSFNFINQFGEIVSQETFKNKVYIANFIFTTCNGICPDMTSNMSLIQTEFKNYSDLSMISHSVTPEVDTVSVLRTFADSYGAIKDKWHIVTGNRDDIYALARKSYFADEDLGIKKSTQDFLHTENFFLIDKNKRIRGVYNGTLPADTERLITDIKTLKEESL